MTTAKRRIPINNHDPAAGHAEAAPPVDEPMPSNEATGATNGAEGSQTTAPGAVATALDEISRERDVLADALLRLRAEFDNFRKRAARELVEARERSQGELLTELLPVLDNLERALDAAEHHDEGKVLGGVRMTRDMFVALVKGAGVEEIGAVGEPFDPHTHDAMIMQPSEQEEGTVTAVLERGYRLGDRILRPAKVAVSSGPGASARTRDDSGMGR